MEGDSRHVGYIGIIDQLTINEENKLRRKVETLTEKQDEIQKMKYEYEQEMKSMREEMESKFQQVLAKIDTSKLNFRYRDSNLVHSSFLMTIVSIL